MSIQVSSVEAEPNIDYFQKLKSLAISYLSSEECAVLEQAYVFAHEAHEGQYRKSGEPYIIHPVEVACILADLHMDIETLVAALLHDTVEDCDVTIEDVRDMYGESVAHLVDGITKITQIEVESLTESQAINLRKMLVAMSHDVRVIVIKLADRLHNMRTLMALKEDRRIFKAKETMEIYAPLAHRLGMNSIKWELEDLSFFYLEPQKYQQIQKMVNETRDAREKYMNEVIDVLSTELSSIDLHANIYGRPKHLYSIYQKMTNKGKDFSEIYDLIALRVIVNTIPECYTSLGAVHNLWHPMPGRFKDYIAMPKFNMYQSLHTTVIGPAGRPLEIQIRTVEMHHYNEYGIAAHWRYKDGSSANKSSKAFDDRLNWLREMLDEQLATNDSREFLDVLRYDLFDSEVFVFTPKGEVINLRAGSTPLDFAYAIHTEVGNHCVGAKVNGNIVPLTYQLVMGDRVEILTQKNASPSHDWLTIVQTPSARSKIRSYFSKANRGDDLVRGRDMLAKEVRKDGVGISSSRSAKVLEQISEELNYANADELFVAIGSGKLTARQIANRILRALNKAASQEQKTISALPKLDLTSGADLASIQRKKRKKYNNNSGVEVKGIEDVYVRLSRCCNPVPGDEIIGFITRGRGVSVHRADCPNAKDLQQNPERIIDVSWEKDVEVSFQVEIFVEAIDRTHLLEDVLIFLGHQGVNIVSCNATAHKDDIVEMRFLLEVPNIERIEQILRDILTIDGVFGAKRMLPNASSKQEKKK